MTTHLRLWTFLLVSLVLAAPVAAGTFELLHYDEATIADIQAAFKAKTLTCRMLVQMYLDRIDAYDKKGPRSMPSLSSILRRSRSPTSSMRYLRSPVLWAHCTVCQSL